MKDLILVLIKWFLQKIMGFIWFFLRPIFYLYFVWFGMKIAALFH
jgi:hypothetical protein